MFWQEKNLDFESNGIDLYPPRGVTVRSGSKLELPGRNDSRNYSWKYSRKLWKVTSLPKIGPATGVPRPPPKNGEIALCELATNSWYVKNDKDQWCNILITFKFKFNSGQYETNIFVLSNLSKDAFTSSQY